MQKLFDFMLLSSKDPNKFSLTLKMALLGLIPYLMQAWDLVCGFRRICVDMDQGVFEQIAEAIADLTFYGLSFIATIGALYGLGRKLWRTFDGRNKALDL